MLSLHRGAAGHVLRRYQAGATKPLGALPILSRGERDAETAAMAVPVFGAEDALLGALSLSGPIGRFDDARVSAKSAQPTEAGPSLSRELGGGAAWP